MRLRFNPDVRKAMADELRKVSTFGGIALGAMGYASGVLVILLGAFIWWVVCQVTAMLLLSVEDDE